ncbi:hypothetical protein EVAR_72899_1 [Eumeta japonica]|uniref:Uncharacterized protein n=1 Tax=Eumeta variegata TaxID=151549 RepID=A0A4C1SW36_EUMVA|nr:hypothetical protein EVAR_72899_1 [Eumeta japonica]
MSTPIQSASIQTDLRIQLNSEDSQSDKQATLILEKELDLTKNANNRYTSAKVISSDEAFQETTETEKLHLDLQPTAVVIPDEDLTPEIIYKDKSCAQSNHTNQTIN